MYGFGGNLQDNRADNQYTRQHGDRRACQPCSTAKAKCIYTTTSQEPENVGENGAASSRQEQRPCERCARLKKSCAPQAAASTERKKRNPPKTPSRGAQLEQKLDNLVNMLASSRASGDSPQQSSTTDSQSPASSSNGNATNTQEQEGCPGSILLRAKAGTGDECAAQQGDDRNRDEVSDDQPSPGLTAEEVKLLVDFWRPRLLEYFPFVSISPDERTETVVREKPYLSISMAVAALFGDRKRQISLAEELLKGIGMQVLGNGTKNLDLLQSVLVLLAWYHSQAFVNAQTTNLLYLASALLVDLGLNARIEKVGTSRVQLFATRFAHGPTVNNFAHRSLAEHRALAGCYYMNSTFVQNLFVFLAFPEIPYPLRLDLPISIPEVLPAPTSDRKYRFWCAFQRIDPIHYNAHIDHACNEISRARALPSDRLLVHSVHGQHILERIIVQINESDNTLDVAAYEAELENVRDGWPTDLKDNPSLLLLHHNAQMDMHHYALLHWDEVNSSISKSSRNGLDKDQMSRSRRQELRWIEERHDQLFSACETAFKNFFDAFQKIPSNELYNIPFSIPARIGHALIILASLNEIPSSNPTSTTFPPKQRPQVSSAPPPPADPQPNQTFPTLLKLTAQKLDSPLNLQPRHDGLPLDRKNHVFGHWAWSLRAFRFDVKKSEENSVLDERVRDAFKDVTTNNLRPGDGRGAEGMECDADGGGDRGGVRNGSGKRVVTNNPAVRNARPKPARSLPDNSTSSSSSPQTARPQRPAGAALPSYPYSTYTGRSGDDANNDPRLKGMWPNAGGPFIPMNSGTSMDISFGKGGADRDKDMSTRVQQMDMNTDMEVANRAYGFSGGDASAGAVGGMYEGALGSGDGFSAGGYGGYGDAVGRYGGTADGGENGGFNGFEYGYGYNDPSSNDPMTMPDMDMNMDMDMDVDVQGQQSWGGDGSERLFVGGGMGCPQQ
ncbi:MAG: hypothetical protein M1831_000834 [Alyxoria varia]|nr:MAG: hypothetical protein M1831_000834 [Alyxoria varia]